MHVLNNKINSQAPKQKERENSCELGQSWEQDLVACLQHGVCPFPVSEFCLALLSSAVLGRAAELEGSKADAFHYPLFQQPPDCYQGHESLNFRDCISHSSMTSNVKGELGLANSCTDFSAPISLGWDERDGICACILFYRS